MLSSVEQIMSVLNTEVELTEAQLLAARLAAMRKIKDIIGISKYTELEAASVNDLRREAVASAESTFAAYFYLPTFAMRSQGMGGIAKQVVDSVGTTTYMNPADILALQGQLMMQAEQLISDYAIAKDGIAC